MYYYTRIGQTLKKGYDDKKQEDFLSFNELSFPPLFFLHKSEGGYGEESPFPLEPKCTHGLGKVAVAPESRVCSVVMCYIVCHIINIAIKGQVETSCGENKSLVNYLILFYFLT